jgi:UDP-N-acetylglucosamine/UDP-N-acetylgalactosamine 4-epimerase
VTATRALSETMVALRADPRVWLVTGVAGFIGSNLLEALLALGQTVVGIDNFATGSRSNLADVKERVGEAWSNFRFVDGDITRPETCSEVCTGVSVVLHQAALGSVPRSVADPIASNNANVSGFVNICVAARDAGVSRLVYASSSSVYGDDPSLPKLESRLGRPLSPYAVTKIADELYAGTFARTFDLPVVGLRYFNVFGRRQSPEGPYAAVVPRWIAAQLRGEPCVIYGDGEASRDFCYVDNVVQANLLSATCSSAAIGDVFNIAVGQKTTLNTLHQMLWEAVAPYAKTRRMPQPIYASRRPGDILHSEADIGKARDILGYAPTHDLGAGLAETIDWYCSVLKPAS